nr:unnamed protein product [Callosobruchus chinensis]
MNDPYLSTWFPHHLALSSLYTVALPHHNLTFPMLIEVGFSDCEVTHTRDGQTRDIWRGIDHSNQLKNVSEEKWKDAYAKLSKIAEHRRTVRLIDDPALTCHLQPLSHRAGVALVTPHSSTGIQMDSAPPS